MEDKEHRGLMMKLAFVSVSWTGTGGGENGTTRRMMMPRRSHAGCPRRVRVDRVVYATAEVSTSKTRSDFRSDGSRLWPVPVFIRLLEAAKDGVVSGVYAVLDTDEVAQFVGKSKDVVRKLKEHQNAVPDAVEKVALLRIQTMDVEDVEADATVQRWIDEYIEDDGDTPEGNRDMGNVWTGGNEGRSPEERAFVQGDASAEPPSVVTSPFAEREPVSEFDSNEPLPLTEENVDLVLDQVRPYLMSDGGNVSVHAILPSGDVELVLEGACGSCASSTTTMKMGIEKALRARFPDLGEVVAISEPAVSPALDTGKHERAPRVGNRGV